MTIKNETYESGDDKYQAKAEKPALHGIRVWINKHWIDVLPGANIARTFGRDTGAGHGYFSVHAEGRAFDLGCGQSVPWTWSMQLAHALVNVSEELGITSVIHNKSKWNSNKAAWQKYDGAYPHTNHVHFEVSREFQNKSDAEIGALWDKYMSKPNVSDPFPNSKRPWDVKATKSRGLPGAVEAGPGKVSGGKPANGGVSASDGGGDKAATVEGVNYGPVGEENLVGMESYKAYLNNMKGYSGTYVPTDYDKDFTIVEKKEVADIQANMDAGKATPADYANRGITFLGLSGIMYGILMVSAYAFDRSNNIFEFNALNKMTLGKLESVADPDDVHDTPGTKYVGWRGVLKYAAIAIGFSLLLISGALMGWLSDLIVFLQEHTGGQ